MRGFEAVFGELRSGVHAQTAEGWARVCEALELFGRQDDVEVWAQGLAYAREQLGRWPEEVMRVCPARWLRDGVMERGRRGALLELGHVMRTHVLAGEEVSTYWDGVVREEGDEDEGEEEELWALMTKENADWGHETGGLEVVFSSQEPPSWELHLAMMLTQERVERAQRCIDFSKKHGWLYEDGYTTEGHTTKGHAMEEPWSVEMYWLADSASVFEWSALVVDHTWRMNGWHYGWWTLRAEYETPVFIMPGEPEDHSL